MKAWTLMTTIQTFIMKRVSINMTRVGLSSAVTRGQKQCDASAQLKSSQFLLEDWEPSNIRQNQLFNPVASLIMVAVESQSLPEWKHISDTTSHTKTLCRQWDRLSIISGMLYRKWVSDESHDTKNQLIVPQILQLDVFSNHHEMRVRDIEALRKCFLAYRIIFTGLQ